MERLKQLVEIIKDFPDMPLSFLLKLEFEYKSIWNSLEVSFFLTLAYYKLRKFDKSLEYLERFLKESKNKNKDYNEYYTIAKHYIKLKLDNKTNDEIKKELCKQLSNKTIINEIIHDLENPDNVFKHFTYPNCPDCLNCSLSKHCITRHKIEFTKIINAEMLNRQVNQMQIKDIL
jgi:ribosomal protein S12 methylthiotransferase accessory factor